MLTWSTLFVCGLYVSCFVFYFIVVFRLIVNVICAHSRWAYSISSFSSFYSLFIWGKIGLRLISSRRLFALRLDIWIFHKNWQIRRKGFDMSVCNIIITACPLYNQCPITSPMLNKKNQRHTYFHIFSGQVDTNLKPPVDFDLCKYCVKTVWNHFLSLWCDRRSFSSVIAEWAEILWLPPLSLSLSSRFHSIIDIIWANDHNVWNNGLLKSALEISYKSEKKKHSKNHICQVKWKKKCLKKQFSPLCHIHIAHNCSYQKLKRQRHYSHFFGKMCSVVFHYGWSIITFCLLVHAAMIECNNIPRQMHCKRVQRIKT